MKTKSRSSRKLDDGSPFPAPAPVDPMAESPESPDTSDRVSVPLKDGAIDLDGMREKTKDKILSAIRKTPIEGSAPTQTGIPPFVVPAVCQALSAIATAILMKVTGASMQVVAPIAAFTDEETAMLSPSVLALLDKYLASSLSKYGEEAAFLMLVYAIGNQKLARIRIEMKKTEPAPVAA